MSGNPGELVPIPAQASRLGEAFAAAGHQLYLVGGPVRDALMGRPVNDLDFTTDARPEQVLAILSETALGSLDDRHRVRDGRWPGRWPAVRDHHLPRRSLRPGQPQSGGGLRRQHR